MQFYEKSIFNQFTANIAAYLRSTVKRGLKNSFIQPPLKVIVLGIMCCLLPLKIFHKAYMSAKFIKGDRIKPKMEV